MIEGLSCQEIIDLASIHKDEKSRQLAARVHGVYLGHGESLVLPLLDWLLSNSCNHEEADMPELQYVQDIPEYLRDPSWTSWWPEKYCYWHWDGTCGKRWDCLLYTSPSPRDRQKSR